MCRISPESASSESMRADLSRVLCQYSLTNIQRFFLSVRARSSALRAANRRSNSRLARSALGEGARQDVGNIPRQRGHGGDPP
jgi:hypothetical protein